MPDPRYSAGDTALNAFLFEFLGREGNGRQLTVLSALARKGLDPWQEAARLSELPKEAAAIAVADLFTDMDTVFWDIRDMRHIAGRLVDRLPRSNTLPIGTNSATNVGKRSISSILPAAAPYRRSVK